MLRFLLIANQAITIPIVSVFLIRQISSSENAATCTANTCEAGQKCCGDVCCSKVSPPHQQILVESWYFWVGIVASVLLFLGFLTLCICYLKKSLTATLSLVQSIPNDMVIIRTVQDPNGIIRPEVAQYAPQNRYGKPPRQDASEPETSNSMLPLDPAYPPVRAVTTSSAHIQRNSQNLAEIIMPPGYIEPNTIPDS